MYYLINLVPIALILLIIVKLAIDIVRQYIRESEFKKKITKLEGELEAEPNKTETSWDLARVLLEKYINQNLTQLSFIFWLTVIIVLLGFSLIVNGINKIYNDPASFEPAILSGVSGILVEFIGATFFFMYRTTMSQAKEYVLLLERLSRERIGIQTLGKMADGTFKDQATADLIKQITLPFSSQKK